MCMNFYFGMGMGTLKYWCRNTLVIGNWNECVFQSNTPSNYSRERVLDVAV